MTKIDVRNCSASNKKKNVHHATDRAYTISVLKKIIIIIFLHNNFVDLTMGKCLYLPLLNSLTRRSDCNV